MPTTVHWHGLILPNAMDGVPFVTQPPIPPGQRQRIHYPLVQNGTFWMHSHYGLQTQSFVAEPFVILDAEQERWADRTITVMLQDFSFTPASQILDNVVAGERGGGTAMAKRLADFPWQEPRPLLSQRWDEANQRFGWQRQEGVLMMAPDVVYDALLANERSLDNPEIIDVKPGETVAIRWIAGSAFMSFFLDLGELEGELQRTDANPVEPIRGSVFQLALAQRLTMRIQMPEEPGNVGMGQAADALEWCCAAPCCRPLARAMDQLAGFHSRQAAASPNPDTPRPADEKRACPQYRAGFYPYRDPYWVEDGQRVEMVFTNPTPMGHPMHLHGHEFQILELMV